MGPLDVSLLRRRGRNQKQYSLNSCCVLIFMYTNTSGSVMMTLQALYVRVSLPRTGSGTRLDVLAARARSGRTRA